MLILGVGMLSTIGCSKDEIIRPEQQRVTYIINCKDCLITMEDDKWNSKNELDRSKSQSFNVKGDFKYSFVNESGLNSVTASIYVSALDGYSQRVILTIKDNLGRINTTEQTLGFSMSEDYDYEFTSTLKLK